MSAAAKTVLITGCSTGIGRATALHLAYRGYTVYATARTPADIADLQSDRIRTLALDVTDDASMVEAVRTIEAAAGVIDVLVNNAGYSQSGAIESVAIDRVRRQFETNVIGAVRLTQLVLPGMRRAGGGRIVNVGSMGGRFTFPGAGFYHATKYALEAISDALRFEVAGFGVATILIEPGLIRTAFGTAAERSIARASDAADPYAAFNATIAKVTREAYEDGPLARLGAGPEAVARVIERAIVAVTPKARYTVTPSAVVLINLRRFMPDGLWDRFVGSQIARPGRPVR